VQKASTSPGSKQSAFVVVRAEEWEGLYIDGRLVVEGHNLTAIDVLAALGIRASSQFCDEDWLADEGCSLPIELGEVKFR
jgi:hypothetical protein